MIKFFIESDDVKIMKKIKFIISISLVICISTLFCSSALAVETSNRNNEMNERKYIQYDDPIDRLNPNDYIVKNEALVSKGRAARASSKGSVTSYARSYKVLDVTHYYQSGEIWSNDIMQTEGLTIGSAGCCLTSFAMVQRYFGGIYNPRGVNNKLGDYACPFNWTGAASTFDYTIENYKRGKVTDDYAIDFIIGAIDSDLPVIVGLTNDSTGKTHFVAAYGYSGDTIYIHDPSSSRDYTELDDYLANYYVHRLYVYSAN